VTHIVEKLFFHRVPQLRFAPNEPIIYWFDLENDKIRVTCDDDLSFFMNESEIRKLTFEYSSPQESTRKRRSTILIDEDEDEVHSECSKRLRKIDLSSDTSMDTDSDDEREKREQVNVTSSNDVQVPPTFTATEKQISSEAIPSTSREENLVSKVNIISVETIPTDDALNNNSKSNIVDNEVVVVEEIQQEANINGNDSGNETSNETQPATQRRRNSESNRIVISDSSEEEVDDEDNGNSNFYGRHESSFNNNNHRSYSFSNAGVNGARSRANENFNNFIHNNIRDHHRRTVATMRRNMVFFRDNMRSTEDSARESAREAVRLAQANINNARRYIPNEMLRNFRDHFHPLFQGNFSGNNYRR
jgi:hypothetical protein